VRCIDPIYCFDQFPDFRGAVVRGDTAVLVAEKPPVVVALAVIATQAVGSVLLFINRAARIGAILLGGFTLVATALAHGFWNQSGPAYARERITFLEHLGSVGGLILAGFPFRGIASLP
jgi:uncharacterized membrane protein YphA (DoxX/SURF4 family)